MLALFAARSNHKKNEGGNDESIYYCHGTRHCGRGGKGSGLCSELNINIEDVTQSILQGMFAMIMLVDLSHCNVGHRGTAPFHRCPGC